MAGIQNIRRATAADSANVRTLTRAAYAKWVPLIGREPLPMTADYDRAVAEHIVELLEQDGRLVGLVELVPENTFLMIENLAVDPGHQRQGVGERLLRHAEDLARSLGHSETRLYTNAAFAANIAFYARRGYEEFERRSIVPGSMTVFMRKWLGGA